MNVSSFAKFVSEARILLEYPNDRDLELDLSNFSSGFLCVPGMPEELCHKYWPLHKIGEKLDEHNLWNHVLKAFILDIAKTGLPIPNVAGEMLMLEFFKLFCEDLESNLREKTVRLNQLSRHVRMLRVEGGTHSNRTGDFFDRMEQAVLDLEEEKNSQLKQLLARVRLLHSVHFLFSKYNTTRPTQDLSDLLALISRSNKNILKVLKRLMENHSEPLMCVLPSSREVSNIIVSQIADYFDGLCQNPSQARNIFDALPDVLPYLDCTFEFNTLSSVTAENLLVSFATNPVIVLFLLSFGANPRALLPRLVKKESTVVLSGADDVVSSILCRYGFEKLFETSLVGQSINCLLEAGGSLRMSVFNFVISTLVKELYGNGKYQRRRFDFLLSNCSVEQYNLSSFLNRLKSVFDKIYGKKEERYVSRSVQLRIIILKIIQTLTKTYIKLKALSQDATKHDRVKHEAKNAAEMMQFFYMGLACAESIPLSGYTQRLENGEKLFPPTEYEFKIVRKLKAYSIKMGIVSPPSSVSKIRERFVEYISMPEESEEFMQAVSYASLVYQKVPADAVYKDPHSLYAALRPDSESHEACLLLGHILNLMIIYKPPMERVLKKADELLKLSFREGMAISVQERREAIKDAHDLLNIPEAAEVKLEAQTHKMIDHIYLMRLWDLLKQYKMNPSVIGDKLDVFFIRVQGRLLWNVHAYTFLVPFKEPNFAFYRLSDLVSLVPLQMAIEYQHEGLFNFLIEEGVDVNFEVPFRKNPYTAMIAAFDLYQNEDRRDMAERFLTELIKNGANIKRNIDIFRVSSQSEVHQYYAFIGLVSEIEKSLGIERSSEAHVLLLAAPDEPGVAESKEPA